MEANVSQKANVLQALEKVTPAQVPNVPEVAERFKKLYGIIHPGAKSEVFYEAEKFHFMKLVSESVLLKECTKFSLYGCFMDVAVNGLSFDPSFKHLYIVPYSHNAGSRNNPVWEKRAQLQVSGQGELLLRQLQGQIKYADNPVLVYEGDEFSFGVRDDKFFINHIAHLPRKSENIIACYIKIVRNDGSADYKVLTQDDMNRFRKFSKDADKSKAWNEGLGGMWQAKCIKHAFRNYPKVRTGDFSTLQSQQVDTEVEVESSVIAEKAQMVMPDKIDYGMSQEQPNLVPQSEQPRRRQTPVHQAQNTPVQDDDFMNGTLVPESTVTVEDDDF